MLNILITEPKGYSKKAIETLKSLGKVKFYQKGKNIYKLISNTDILVVKLGLIIDKKLINRAKKLKIIATSTTGLNHIDVDYAKKKNIAVLSLRGERKFLSKIPSTAEHTLGLILALIRKTPWAFESVKEKKWERERFYGRELFGKTLGILGYGRLGKMVAKYGKALGLKVIAYDPQVKAKEMLRGGIKPVSFNTLFKNSDIVSIHVLLTPETEGLIKEKHLKLMKPSAYLINTSRGELIKKGAFYKALTKKWVAGAALDVLTKEKPDGSHFKNNPLIKYARKNQNLLIVPHLGGATFDAMEKTEVFLAKKIKKYFKIKK